jgi:hypothetical protein
MKSSAPAVALVIAGAMLLAFGTSVRALWSVSSRPWWLVYALWAAAIVALGLVAAATRDRRP